MRLVENADEHEAPERPDNVIRLPVITILDVDADTVLQSAIGKLDSVIVIGYIKGDRNDRSSGDEYFASSIAAGDTVVWLLERYKLKLLQMADEPVDDTA